MNISSQQSTHNRVVLVVPLNLKVIEGPSTVEGGELRANDAGGQVDCSVHVRSM